MLRRFWRFTTASRKRKVISAFAALALVASGTTLAAIIINSGVNGTGSGSVTTQTTTNPAVTITVTGSPVLDPAGITWAAGTVKNNTSQPEVLNTVTASFTSTPAACASHLSFAGTIKQSSSNVIGATIPAGQTYTMAGNSSDGISLAADGSTPVTCAGATWTATFAGTTTP